MPYYFYEQNNEMNQLMERKHIIILKNMYAKSIIFKATMYFLSTN